jgi:hypothetical protein
MINRITLLLFIGLAWGQEDYLEQIESFTICTFASLLENDVGIKNLPDKGVKLVNRQLKKSDWEFKLLTTTQRI